MPGALVVGYDGSECASRRSNGARLAADGDKL